jgi:hypothetical protein
MASVRHNPLQRALRDLSEAVPALFGLQASGPELVAELLRPRDVERPEPRSAAPLRRRPSPPRSRRGRAQLHLVD